MELVIMCYVKWDTGERWWIYIAKAEKAQI